MPLPTFHMLQNASLLLGGELTIEGSWRSSNQHSDPVPTGADLPTYTFPVLAATTFLMAHLWQPLPGQLLGCRMGVLIYAKKEFSTTSKVEIYIQQAARGTISLWCFAFYCGVCQYCSCTVVCVAWSPQALSFLLVETSWFSGGLTHMPIHFAALWYSTRKTERFPHSPYAVWMRLESLCNSLIRPLMRLQVMRSRKYIITYNIYKLLWRPIQIQSTYKQNRMEMTVSTLDLQF